MRKRYLPWHLSFFTFLSLFLLWSSITPVFAGSGTITGTVNVPEFDSKVSGTKYKPAADRFGVRVMGTDISTTLDGSYAFTLTNAPSGSVQIILDQDADVNDPGDWFTHASRIVSVNVPDGGSVQADITPVPHWTEISYPAPHGTTGYSEWTTQFLSAGIGFILYEVDPGSGTTKFELWRTTDGGVNWTNIKTWPYDSTAHNNGTTYPSADQNFYFSDANHGLVQGSVGGIGGGNRGFYYTSDGGQNWGYSSPPTPSTSYGTHVQRFSSLLSTHYVLAGTTGEHVQGYSEDYWDVVWESTDAGQSWTIKIATETDYGCTGLGVFTNGNAIATYTPFGGSNRYYYRDGATGNWSGPETTVTLDFANGSTQAGTPDVNSGYGPADIAVFDTTSAYISADGYAPHFYRTDDSGQTWEEVADYQPQYMSFANESIGFALFGGPAFITRDGGLSWLHQADGEGLCCGGNIIWAFGETSAVWYNNTPQVLAYNDPSYTAFEATPSPGLKYWFAAPGDTAVPMGSYILHNQGTESISVTGLTVVDQRPTNAHLAVDVVRLWLDANTNGYPDLDDTILANGVFDVNGKATLTFSTITLKTGIPKHLLVTYDINSRVGSNVYFISGLQGDAITATASGLPITASSPENYQLPGRVLVTAKNIFTTDFSSGLSGWTPSTLDAPWTAYADIGPTGTMALSTTAPDRSVNNFGANNYLTLDTSVDISESLQYILTFDEERNFDPLIYAEVDYSINGGTSWTNLVSLGDSSVATSTDGKWAPSFYQLPLSSNDTTLKLRFNADWTSSWYYYYTWSLDNVRVLGLSVTDTLADDFESGDTSALAWNTYGDSSWSVTTDGYQSIYAACSGPITDSESTTLELSATIPSGDVSFYLMTSSEADYDEIEFYINGVLQNVWSGQGAYSKKTFPVSAGSHTLKWVYTKDSSVSEFDDKVCIDDLFLPSVSESTAQASIVTPYSNALIGPLMLLLE